MARSAHWKENNSSTTGSGRSQYSHDSYHTESTASTEYSDRQQEYFDRRIAPSDKQQYSQHIREKRRASVQSVDTYASTDEEEFEEGEELYEPSRPSSHRRVHPTNVVPATPLDFGHLFPSSKRLTIRHDDATEDGNMNLRVDTGVISPDGRKINMTLFHMRLQDLATRAFSLRRYYRESGREVCHCIRKYQKPPSDRPVLQRSFSSALGAFRTKNDSRPSTAAGLARADSGYESIKSFDLDDDAGSMTGTETSTTRQSLPTNTIQMEFSNYAHVDVKRRGTHTNKRYAFEFWGVKYVWRRSVKMEGDVRFVSYHLMKNDNDKVLAQIVPMRLSPAQREDEKHAGGWIPPCYFRILDEALINSKTDVSDVLVSSGLIALVDDHIRWKWHFDNVTQLQIPLPLSRNGSWKLNVDYIGPKRLIDEMFHRRPRSQPTGISNSPARRGSG